MAARASCLESAQEALDCACGLYLGDTTAWLDPPPPWPGSAGHRHRPAGEWI